MFIPAQMRALPGQVFVTAASGFRLTWKSLPPAARPHFAGETVLIKAHLLARIEHDPVARLKHPLLGLYGAADLRALPTGTTVLDTVPLQYRVRGRDGNWVPSLWRADVSARAATRFRTELARLDLRFLDTFFVPVDRTCFIAWEHPLLMWLYGPAVPG